MRIFSLVIVLVFLILNTTALYLLRKDSPYFEKIWNEDLKKFNLFNYIIALILYFPPISFILYSPVSIAFLISGKQSFFADRSLFLILLFYPGVFIFTLLYTFLLRNKSENLAMLWRPIKNAYREKKVFHLLKNILYNMIATFWVYSLFLGLISILFMLHIV